MAYSSKKVGIVGAGQLGRMMALCGYPQGVDFRFLDPAPQSPAAPLGEMVLASYDDAEALSAFVKGIDVATYEFENVPYSTAEFLEKHVPTYPPARALAISQDRLSEKQTFQRLGIPCADFAAVASREELLSACEKMGFPCILKTRRLGYDGKGQVLLKSVSDAQSAWEKLGSSALILEGFVPFSQEFSILAARSANGQLVVYPIVKNVHKDGILRFSLPLPWDEVASEVKNQALSFAQKLLNEFDYVGVLAIETFFKDGQLIANEIAPRVHNSGHWTIEGAETSQFKNHLLAILGQPLGAVELRGRCAMINLIGQLPQVEGLTEIAGVNVHLYAKEPRAGRKIGHITVWGANKQELDSRLAQVAQRMELDLKAWI